MCRTTIFLWNHGNRSLSSQSEFLCPHVSWILSKIPCTHYTYSFPIFSYLTQRVFLLWNRVIIGIWRCPHFLLDKILKYHVNNSYFHASEIFSPYNQYFKFICWGYIYIVKPANAVTCIKRSSFSCPVIENLIWIEPLLRGHLSYKTTFYWFQRWHLDSQTCIKRLPLGQRKSGLIRQVTFWYRLDCI
jgi:hypothetical protein